MATARRVTIGGTGVIGATMGALMFHLLATALAGPIALPGCPESCGEIGVPYPFGIGHGCFYEGFNLTCDNNEKLFLGDGVEVLNISLPHGTVHVRSKILLSDSPGFNGSWSGLAATGPFMVSSRGNWFVAFGCNIVAEIIPYGSAGYGSTCAAKCVDVQQNSTGPSCSAIGSCQTTIGWGVHSYDIQVRQLMNGRKPSGIRPHKAAFIVDNDCFTYYFDENYDQRRCNCSQGYEGNPYIRDGCQDIDECSQPDVYSCHGTCINVPGTYKCSSKTSIRSLPGVITIIAISGGFGLLFSLLGVTKISKKLEQRRSRKLKQKFFKKNHGLLLQQLISSNKDIAERTKIFSLEELEQATNKFDQNRILGGGGHAKVSDFGASGSISIDETGILTAIQGTHGYLDPEYYYTSRLTEKSDVYSFGVILAELLTRLKPVFSSHSSEGTSLASHFASLIRDNRLSDILDPQIVEEGGTEDAKAVARLAEACLNLKGEERPTMRQVETTLEDVQSSKVHHNSQTTKASQNVPKYQSCNEGTRLYSLEKEFIESSEIPR
ncbi:unnamed protein product [Urochloa decumbens]|uniref:Protein kinase domain-containing protein n=1 Tax=Urochloa decumbens TaxID=240449 RepID=A0ABC9D149_9POAL